MKVIFRRSDGKAEKTIDVSPTSKLGENRKAAQMLLGLPENSSYSLTLLRNNRELEDRLSFEEAGIKIGDELILSPTKPGPSSDKSASKVNIQDLPAVVPLINASPNIEARGNKSQSSPSEGKNWKKAAIAGGVFGVLVVFGMLLTSLNEEPSYTNRPVSSPSAEPSSQSPVSPEAETQPEVGTISQDEAVAVVNSWLDAKTKMNAPPYNREILSQVATGQQYDNAAGTINWLQQNNAYYRYNSQQIERLSNFYASGERAAVQVVVVEDLVLYENGNINSNRSGLKKTEVVYNLQRIDGAWKIASAAVVN